MLFLDENDDDVRLKPFTSSCRLLNISITPPPTVPAPQMATLRGGRREEEEKCLVM